MTRSTVVVLTGGSNPPVIDEDELPDDAVVVAADAGAVHAAALGLSVDVIVGDLDSVPVELLADLEASGTEVQRHAPAKDASDLALALEVAVGRGAQSVLVVGGDDGRFDHVMGNAVALLALAGRVERVTAWFGPARLDVVTGDRPLMLRGQPGELVSLFALDGPARGVRTNGLLYPLDGEALSAASTRGLSNEFVSAAAEVSVEHGTLLVVRPGQRCTHLDAMSDPQPTGGTP